ncbi:MAG TPA: DEAD/DEAH box helicase [Vicinamibacterales bacterium]|nr:DEAD/DEAH box helicase [Vicinamibacterales bacterium]
MPESRAAARPAGFAALGLSKSLVESTTALGYEEPTPVQRETIPLLLEGRDLLGQAATGTGKTAAFALPMLQRIEDSGEAGRRHASGLILVPTRELAMQVAEAVHKYARGTKLTVLPLYGGAPMHQQIRTLERGANIVVATPGRALDHIRRRTLVLEKLQVLILDEADEMLDMGFADDLDAILEATPASRQTALFSATMPPRIRSIAERHLKDPARIAIAGEKPVAGKLPRVRQVAFIVARPHKAAALERVLETENAASALVFCRTRLEVDTLVETLNAHGHRAEALHGGMEQRLRDRVMSRFRDGTADLLVATDVAARGLDIERLSHVINYDVPNSSETYLHRIGRTGRAGREGTAITLVEPREHRLLRSMEAVTKQRIEVAPVPTVADLRARRLELTRASLRERLLAGGLDQTRVVVESLAQEFDVLDIAAAAVQLAHTATAGEGDDKEIPATGATPAGDRPGDRRPLKPARGHVPPKRQGREGGHVPAERGGAARDGDMVRLFVGAGRRAGVRPGDLVGAITGESGLEGRSIGAIEINDAFSLVEVPADRADDIVVALRGTKIRGLKPPIRRER